MWPSKEPSVCVCSDNCARATLSSIGSCVLAVRGVLQDCDPAFDRLRGKAARDLPAAWPPRLPACLEHAQDMQDLAAAFLAVGMLARRMKHLAEAGDRPELARLGATLMSGMGTAAEFAYTTSMHPGSHWTESSQDSVVDMLKLMVCCMHRHVVDHL